MFETRRSTAGNTSMSISFRNDLIGTELKPANGTFASARLPGPAEFKLVEPQVEVARMTDRSGDPRSIEARLTEIKNGASPRELPDVKMDQIRELLFGEAQRQGEQRLITLEVRVRELEAALHHRLDAMQARIDAFAAESKGDRRSTLDELARGVADLGDRIKRIPRE
jgi:5-carboxymethyl-2-hydroxymuconate isomerase